MKKISYYLVYLLFIISFTKGILELLGINETYLQLVIDIFILIIFSISILFILQNRKIIFPGLKIFITLFTLIIISFLLNDVTLLQLSLFLRKLFIYILFFYAIINIDFEKYQKENFFNLLVFLFSIQVIAALIKLFVLGGTQEKIVGTMSVMEGSLATIMPLLAVSFLVSLYLYYNRIKFVIIILLFVSIGLISNKLGILFYLFILFILLTFFYTNKISKTSLFNISFIKYMMKVGLYLIIIFMLFVSLNPRANPEHKVGGSIDIEYLIEFTKDYNTLELKGSTVEADGRADAPIVALDKLSKGGLFNILLGYGPGDIVQSSFLKYNDPLLEKYNIGYGGRLGQVWIMMQLGVLGLVVFSIFHIFLFKRIYDKYKISKLNNQSIRLLSVLGISIVFFIDFFTYSSQMLYSSGVVIFYYYSIYYSLTEKEI